jgi:hypothetical protein
MGRVATVISTCLFFLAVLNFIAYSTISSRIGGTAMNGYAQDGHYFVGSHGAYTEVSVEAWERSRLHGRSVGIGYVLAIGAVALVQVGPMVARWLRR